MKTAPSSMTGSGINTDRISIASRQLTPKAGNQPVSSKTSDIQASSFKREVPMPAEAKFVEIDGKKYFLDAPRGTYLNILV